MLMTVHFVNRDWRFLKLSRGGGGDFRILRRTFSLHIHICSLNKHKQAYSGCQCDQLLLEAYNYMNIQLHVHRTICKRERERKKPMDITQLLKSQHVCKNQLCMLGNFSCFYCRLMSSKSTFSKDFSRNTIRGSNSMDSDQES